MSEAKQDDGSCGLAAFAIVVACVGAGIAIGALVRSCRPATAPTPATCCDSKECREQLAQVDARFGGVWEELVEMQEQLAKVNPCCCEPPKPCVCSDKPACECKPVTQPAEPSVKTAPKLQECPACVGRSGRR